jgi:trimeric autotransporter adhesin
LKKSNNQVKIQIKLLRNHQMFQKTKTMKKIILGIILSLICSVFAQAQVSGTYAIPGASYPTIASAITALNTSGVGTGGVTFNVAAGYTETLPSLTSGLITATGTSANQIIFQKSGSGANPVITAATGTAADYEYIIALQGTDYITFNAINLTDPSGTIEWGYAILKASGTDGAQYVTIKNCTITMSLANTRATYGVYSNNFTPSAPAATVTVVSATGTNSYNKIFSNTFTTCYSSIYFAGFNDLNYPYTFYDQGNEIGKDGANTITNVGGGTAIAYGIYGIYQNNIKVANNSITSNTLAGTVAHYGIFLTTGLNSSYDLYGNTVSMQFSGLGTTSLYPVYCDMGASGLNNTVNVYNNTVTNCTWPTMTTGTLSYLYCVNLGATANVYGNTVSNNLAGSGTVTATGRINYLYTSMTSVVMGTLSFHDNIVTGNARSQSAAGGGATYCMYVGGKAGMMNMYNNSVTNNTIASSGGTYCISESLDYATINFYNNTVSGMSKAEGTTYGLYVYNVTAGGGNVSIYKNSISNIEGLTAGANMYGIYNTNGSGNNAWYYNNMIYDLRTPAGLSGSSFYNTINGIYVSGGGPLGFYYNTVYLNASSTAANFGCSAFYFNTSIATDLRNNIFVNNSTPMGLGKATALRFSSTTYTNFSALSNYNDLYAGPPGASNLLFYDGTNSDQVLSSYKARFTPRELQSVTELPPFVNVSARPYNLHLQAGIATQCESGGTPVSLPLAINTDFDGDARYANTGYPLNASYPPHAPDLGADEFGGIPNDVTPPSITYTPLMDTYNGNPRTLNAVFADGTGVPTGGAGAPALYWRINSGTWLASTGTMTSSNNYTYNYTFSFGGGANIGDNVYYYIAAQDVVTIPNVGVYPWIGSTGYSPNPPSCATPPTTPSTYKINTGISGIFHVGVGKDYTTLTAAATDINAKIISGPLTLILDDATYPSETYPIRFNPNPGSSSTNTLTIKPNTGNSAVFTATIPNPIINFNGIDYVILEGSNNGTTSQNLTITNALNTPLASAILISNNAGDPSTNITIKDCLIQCMPVDASGGNTVISFSSTGGGYDNCIITNNTINSGFTGIALYGASTGISHNCQITNNTIGSLLPALAISDRGIIVQYCDNTLISNNDIMGPNAGSLNTGQTGVFIGTLTTNSKVTKNKIHDFFRSADDGWGATGIWYAAEANSITEISDNIIYNIKSPGMNPGVGQNIVYGMFFRSGGNVKIIHNTINLTGAWLSNTLDASSGCLGFNYQATGGNFEVRNNILRNGQTELASPYSFWGTAYGIMISLPPIAMFSVIDNNDYFIDGYQGTVACQYTNGTGALVNYPTLASWQTYSGQESHSLNVNPGFPSETNLVPTTVAMPHAGSYTALVPTDILSVNRTNPPDMGAYEFTPNPLINTLAGTAVTATTATLNGNANAAGYTFNLFFDYGLTTTYGNSNPATPATVTGSSTNTMSFGATGLLPLSTYHFRARGVTSTGVTVYGNDMAFTTNALPPAVITLAATSVTSGGATLNGSVNPNGVSATVSFDYGLTTAYGSTATAVQSPVNGSSSVSVNTAITGLLPYNTYHFRVKSVSVGGTSYGSDLTFTTNAIPATVITNSASNVTPITATLNGSVNPNYAPATVSFDWGLTTAYGNNVTATPSSVSGSTSTPVLANIVGLSWATTYHFRCVGVNAGGTAYGADMTFNSACPIIPVPGSISGPAAVCQNQNGLTYSISPVTNASGYTWTVPTGATISGGQGSTSINVNYSTTAASGNVTVTPTNACSTGPTGTLAVTVNPMPVPTITGPAAACAGYTNYVYNTQAGMTGYAWTVSAGGSITAGAGTSSITVTWLTTGAKTVTVNYNNANGCTAVNPGTYNVTVNALPVPTITGSNSMCANSGYYSYTTETGMSGYTWTVSSGGSIYAGAGTSAITVVWNNAGAQTVSVNYNNANACQAINPTVLNVTVNDIPAAAGAINGTTTVCAGAQGVPYSVAAVTGAQTYVWTLPTGATIASGAGTNIISVNYAATAVSGAITVQGNNLCGSGTTSPALNITVTPVPAAAGTISGPTAVCQGENGVIYTVPAIANASGYTWTLPAGATITSGANTNTIHVDFSSSASSGSVTVLGTNACGTGASSSLSVTVNSIPPTPTITASGYVLTSSAANGNQWYHDGTEVAGATSQTYTVPASAPGWYWTIVTVGACFSDSSNHKYIQGVGVGEHNADQVNIYPVPNDGRFNISISSQREISYKLDIYNSLGVNVYGGHTITVNGTLVTPIDLGSVASGLYTVVLRNTDNQVIRKVLINK